MRKMVFFITGMNLGGAERVIATLANKYVDMGNEVHLVTLKEAKSKYHLDERIEFSGANLKNSKTFLGKIKNAICSVYFLKKYNDKYSPEVLISFLTNSNITAILVKLLTKRKYTTVISERADPRVRSESLQIICGFLYGKADLVVCQSKIVKEYFDKMNSHMRTVIIENPINKDALYNGSEKIEKRIMCVGRLAPQKNFEMAIKAFNKIYKKYPEYILEIYGEGPSEKKLRELINELLLDNKVIICGTKKNVFSELGNAELFLMTSDFEGFPNALIEAMASGIPVISTKFPTGIAEQLIVDGKNGYTVNMNDTDSLADRMDRILENEDLRHEISKNNKDIINMLGLETIYKKWESNINSI